MIVVSDTSPLVYLGKLGRLDLLPQLYGRVVVPPAVHDELMRGMPAEPALQHVGTWIEVSAPSDYRAVEALARVVDRGEAEAIALALECHAELLLVDDAGGRTLAEAEGLTTQGVLGVLLDAKRAGAIPTIRPELDRLRRETTFRMSGAVYERALRAAKELDPSP